MRLSSVPLQFVPLALALVLWTLQQITRRDDKTTRNRTLRRNIERNSETIFVCLVGTDAAIMRSVAAHAIGMAMYPRAITVGIVVLVQDASGVSDDSTVASDDSISITWRYARDPRYGLNHGRRCGLSGLYNNERYVLMLHGARPVAGWDDACVRLLAQQRSRDEDVKRSGSKSSSAIGPVLTSAPHTQGVFTRASFPLLIKRSGAGDGDESVQISTHAFAVERFDAMESVAWMRGFHFSSHDTIARCPKRSMWVDNQIEQTLTLRRAGISIGVPAIPVCEASTRDGVGVARTRAHDAPIKELGTDPHVGIYDRHDAHELILKYGSVDAAHITIMQASDAFAD